MEFDSPDVAKEFPGLYYEDIDEGGGGGKKGKKPKTNHGSMNDPNDYDDDSDKSSKKKKDKKDSKKDKGYAALAGESSPDEDERPGSKSPGRVNKLKAFKLTSSSKKHKDKDKEKEKDAKADISSKAGAAASSGEPSKKDKKHSLSVEKDLKRERKLSSEAVKPAKSEKSLLDLVRKHSVPNAVSTSVSLAPPTITVIERPSSTGRNRHPLPFSPTAAAAAKEEKHSKKEIIDGVKVRLKLKRGSKNSLEEPAADHPAVAIGPPPSQSQQSPSGRQLPEDPETLAKEIRKYEALLEQSHSQIQSSKKVNKKHEEQLWELQRTLTQLKRKLRSVNALSCASITNAGNTISNPPAVTGTVAKPTHVESAQAQAAQAHPQPQNANVEPQTQQTILQPQKVPIEPVVVVGVVAPPELIPEPVEEISLANPSASTSSKHPPPPPGPPPPPATVETTAQVHATAEVHTAATERTATAKYPITDDREYENVTIGMVQETASSQKRSAVLEKKGSESSSSSIAVVLENASASDRDSIGKSKTSSTNTSTTSHSHVQEHRRLQQPMSDPDGLDEVDNEFSHLHLTNHVDARAKRNSLPSNQRLQRERCDDEGDGDVEYSTSPFNPFAVPVFQTDEFIALENEALIMFNQALQDQIIEEEAEVQKLVKELGGLIEHNHGLLLGVTIQDLEELDNDELVSMLEEVKHENDALHDQVNNLKSLVAKAKLEEFQLELRLKYLQEQGQESDQVQAAAAATTVSVA